MSAETTSENTEQQLPEMFYGMLLKANFLYLGPYFIGIIPINSVMRRITL